MKIYIVHSEMKNYNFFTDIDSFNTRTLKLYILQRIINFVSKFEKYVHGSVYLVKRQYGRFKF